MLFICGMNLTRVGQLLPFSQPGCLVCVWIISDFDISQPAHFFDYVVNCRLLISHIMQIEA